MQYVDEKRQKLLEIADAGAHPPFCDLLDPGTLDWRTMPDFYRLRNRSDGFEGPVQISYEGQQTWSIPRQVHPLSKLLSQVARPKWWNLSCQRPSEYYNAGMGDVQLANTADGAPLGTIAALDRDALRALLEHPHCGSESMDDDMRGRLEVKGSKMHIVPWNGSFPPRMSSEEEWDWAVQYYLDSDSEDNRPIWDPRSLTSPQPPTLPPPNPFTDLATQIQRLWFPGRPITLRFCELALYELEADHHFQLHRDSTHSRAHHGTLLIACGIKDQWDPLRVVLRSEGEEAVLPLRIGDALAFCTDVHHGVWPFKTGTQATLQFDICIEDCTGPDDDDTIDAAMRHNAVTCIKCPTPALPSACVTCRTDSPLYGCDDSDRDTGGANITEYTHWDGRQQRPRLRDPQFNDFTDTADGSLVLTVAAVDVVHQFVREVTSLLRYGEAIPLAPPRTVIFLLSHLPRCMGIQPAYLKGADVTLYQALTSSGELKVFLNHVTYFRYSYEEPRLAPCPPFAPPFTIHNPPVFPEPVLVLDKGGEADHVDRGQILDSEGNARLDNYWQYFAGAMFVTIVRDE